MGMHDREWYRDWQKEQANLKTKEQQNSRPNFVFYDPEKRGTTPTEKRFFWGFVLLLVFIGVKVYLAVHR
jgi:hypothetical protein